jgi:hypothetical protein
MSMSMDQVENYQALQSMGLNFPTNVVAATAKAYAKAYAMDDNQGLVTTATIGTPVQFLQTWLPGFVRTQTVARKIDSVIGMTTVGRGMTRKSCRASSSPWASRCSYGDATNISLASWNTNFERRTVVRFEKGFEVFRLEAARAGASASTPAARSATALHRASKCSATSWASTGLQRRQQPHVRLPERPQPAQLRHRGDGRVLVHPVGEQDVHRDLPGHPLGRGRAADPVAGQHQPVQRPDDPDGGDGGVPVPDDPGGLRQHVATAVDPRDVPADARRVGPATERGQRRRERVLPDADTVEDGSSDNGRVFDQLVPAKFMALGVQQLPKSFIEDFTMATAGTLLKRPWAVVRRSGC